MATEKKLIVLKYRLFFIFSPETYKELLKADYVVCRLHTQPAKVAKAHRLHSWIPLWVCVSSTVENIFLAAYSETLLRHPNCARSINC